VPAEVRRVGAEDAAEIARIVNDYARRLHGTGELTPQEIAEWFDDPRVEAWIGGECYADLADGDDPARLWIDMRGEASSAVLEAAEARAAERGRPGVGVRVVVDADDEPLRALYDASGYQYVRSSFRMRIELDGPPPEPQWPEGITVRVPAEADIRGVYDLYVDSFADHWDFHAEPYERFRRTNVAAHHGDLSLWLLAEAGGEPAGALIARAHPSGEPSAGWISILGVRRPWRGRGLGLALLRASFREFHGRGRTLVELGVDAESETGAVRLYERAGMHVARRSDLMDKPLP
jgi:ribosomal protein S18 acetylase RimI-like enzyme